MYAMEKYLIFYNVILISERLIFTIINLPIIFILILDVFVSNLSNNFIVEGQSFRIT